MGRALLFLRGGFAAFQSAHTATGRACALLRAGFRVRKSEVHSMFPYIRLWGLAIPTYGVLFVAGIALACLLAWWRARRAGLALDDLVVIAAVAIGLGLVGAKLLFFITSVPFSVLVDSLVRGDWSIIAKSGLVFYGGLLGGALGAFWGARLVKARLGDYCDVLVPCIPLAHAFGRVGCFSSGCCYGMPYDGPGAVVYSQAVGGAPAGIPLFPVQLVEAGLNLLVCAGLLWFLRRLRPRWASLGLYLMVYAVERFGLEFLRYDAIRGVFWGVSSSQWISIGLFAVGAGLMLWTYGRERRRRIVSEMKT